MLVHLYDLDMYIRAHTTGKRKQIDEIARLHNDVTSFYQLFSIARVNKIVYHLVRRKIVNAILRSYVITFENVEAVVNSRYIRSNL